MAWSAPDSSETTPAEIKLGKFRAPKLSDRQAPTNNVLNFPSIGNNKAENKLVEEKPDKKQ